MLPLNCMVAGQEPLYLAGDAVNVALIWAAAGSAASDNDNARVERVLVFIFPQEQHRFLLHCSHMKFPLPCESINSTKKAFAPLWWNHRRWRLESPKDLSLMSRLLDNPLLVNEL